MEIRLGSARNVASSDKSPLFLLSNISLWLLWRYPLGSRVTPPKAFPSSIPSPLYLRWAPERNTCNKNRGSIDNGYEDWDDINPQN